MRSKSAVPSIVKGFKHRPAVLNSIDPMEVLTMLMHVVLEKLDIEFKKVDINGKRFEFYCISLKINPI